MEVVVISAIIIVVPLYIFVLKPRHIKRKRDAIQEKPFPGKWESILIEDFPQYNKLPTPFKEDLKNKIKVFLHEKRFNGCKGLEITEKMRVLIAAQACMLLLNRESNFFPKLTTVNVYPTAYVSQHSAGPGGVTHRGNSPVFGESWNTGELVLSWDASVHGATNMFDGKNVVYHEFAHQLDQEDGTADGAPILERRSSYASWAMVLGEEYETLIKKRKRLRKTVLRKYGATHPAEFFAVATEAFFEKPRQLNKRHPELYEELRKYYKISPLEWIDS